MISSIKKFLLINLAISITFVLSILIAGSYVLNNKSIRHHINTHLIQEYHSFYISFKKSKLDINYFKSLQKSINKNSKYQKILKNNVQFQLWDAHGNIILRSPKMPKPFPYTKKSGFKNNKIDSTTWRTYTKYNKKLGITISIAKSYDFEQQLIKQIGINNLLLIFFTYPLLGLLIWLTVTKSLNGIQNLTKNFSNRTATDFDAIKINKIPIEIQPLVKSLNNLFFKLKQSFEHNKNFASNVSHELRTPLAALKTQTQVALLAKTEEKQKLALQSILLGVDQSIHIVQQLLTLSRFEEGETLNDMLPLNLSKISAEILAQLAPLALGKNIEIEFFEQSKPKEIYANETAISILIRNLIDNAIRYTPCGGIIKVKIINEADKVFLYIIDNGAGIPKELRARVFERFYRMPCTKNSGSGLGLAIVQQIAKLHNVEIKLDASATGKGLKVEAAFPV